MTDNMNILKKIKDRFHYETEYKYLVKIPCSSGWIVKGYNNKEDAKKCLNRLKEKPFIVKVDKTN